MIIKERVYENQIKEVRVMISDEVYGCDECQKEIGEDSTLRLTAHNNNGDPSYVNYEFCSWDCCIKFIPKISCDYFVSLPFLQVAKMMQVYADQQIAVI